MLAPRRFCWDTTTPTDGFWPLRPSGFLIRFRRSRSRASRTRRARLEASIEWLLGVLPSQSPVFANDLRLLDSTPVENVRSCEPVKCAVASRATRPGRVTRLDQPIRPAVRRCLHTNAIAATEHGLPRADRATGLVPPRPPRSRQRSSALCAITALGRTGMRGARCLQEEGRPLACQRVVLSFACAGETSRSRSQLRHPLCR